MSAAALFLLLSQLQSQALTLTAAQSFEYAFNGLPLVEPGSFHGQAGVQVRFANNLLDLGDVVRLEMLETSAGSSIPFFSNDFDTPTNHFGASVVVPVSWQDLQGAILISVLSGSVSLDAIDIQVFRQDGRYFQTAQFSEVPIPPTLLLMMAGLLSFASLRGRQPA